jgi:hypothetical protein
MCIYSVLSSILCNLRTRNQKLHSYIILYPYSVLQVAASKLHKEIWKFECSNSNGTTCNQNICHLIRGKKKGRKVGRVKNLIVGDQKKRNSLWSWLITLTSYLKFFGYFKLSVIIFNFFVTWEVQIISITSRWIPFMYPKNQLKFHFYFRTLGGWLILCCICSW